MAKPKDILIYGRVDDWSTQMFFDKLNAALDADEDAEFNFRINTPGGEPTYGIGAIARINELENVKRIKVDGDAMSWGCIACCFVDDVECLDVSRFMIHRLAYSEWFESSSYFTDALRDDLVARNAMYEKAFRNKIDVDAFENLKQVKAKNITIKQIFSMENRIDVFFSAQDAKKIGLVSKIVKITPAIKADIEAYSETDTERRIAAISNKPQTKLNLQVKATADDTEDETDDEIPKETIKTTTMTAEEFKVKFPAAYAEIVKVGTDAERDRVEAALEYVDVDPEAVKTIVASGKPMTQKEMAGFAKKMFSKEVAADLKSDSATETKLPTAEQAGAKKTEKENKMAEFEAKLDAELGLVAAK